MDSKNRDVVKTLADAVDFSLPVCGHVDSTFLVTRIVNNHRMIICEDCFEKVKEADLLTKLWCLPIEIGTCICGIAGPVRPDPDIGMSICDRCRSYTGGKKAELGVIPR